MINTFFKYQGTGNDFILIDNRLKNFPKNNTKLIKHLCDRRFGIGADGLMLLENDEMSDFLMVYYNSDGSSGTMCGNGGRCIVAFAKYLGIIKNKTIFNAADGFHEAFIKGDMVKLKMQNVTAIQKHNSYVFLNTGSPHHVAFYDDIDTIPVSQDGAEIRYNLYGKEGSNINFVKQKKENTLQVRTYERGVEDETFSCGTGVTASAIAAHFLNRTLENTLYIETLGGTLKVTFKVEDAQYTNVFLEGPATFVFKGEITW